MPFMLFALGLPFAVALAVLGAASFAGHRGEARYSPRWAGAVGLGLAVAIGQATAFEWHGRVWPWFESVRRWAEGGEDWPFFLVAGMWIFWVVIAAMIFGMLDSLRPAPAWARWESRLLLIGGLLALLLRTHYVETWSSRQSVVWTLALGSSIFAGWSILELRAVQLGPGMPLPLLIVVGGLAVVMRLVPTIVPVLQAGALASALAGAWVVSWWDQRLNFSRGAMPVFVIAFSGLLIDAYFWQGASKSILLLLAAFPLATFVDRIGPISRLEPRQVGLVRAVAVLVPVGVAVGLAFAWRLPGSFAG